MGHTYENHIYMIKGKKEKTGEWGGGEPGRPGAPFMHYSSLVRVGEPQVLFWLTVVFYICCV